MLGWTTGFGIVPKQQAIMAYVERIASRPAAIRAADLDAALMTPD